MRKTTLVLALTVLLAGCGVGPQTAATRAGGAYGAAAAGKKPTTGKRDGGKLVSAGPGSPIAANVALMFATIDEDHDRAIVAAEWPYDADSLLRGATPHAVPDKDRDGRVSEAEWTAFGMARFKDAPFAQVDVAADFLKVDLDASNALTADEVGLFIGGLAAPVRASLYLDQESVSAWVKAADLDMNFAVDRAELDRLVGELMVRRFGDV